MRLVITYLLDFNVSPMYKITDVTFANKAPPERETIPIRNQNQTKSIGVR